MIVMKRKELFTDSRGFRVHINATMILTRIPNLLEFSNRFFACKNEKKKNTKIYVFRCPLNDVRDMSQSGHKFVLA